MSGPSNLLHDHPQHSRTGGGNGLRYNHHLRVRSVLDCIVAPDHDVREPRLADVQYSKAAALGAVMIGAHALSSVRMAEKRRGPAGRTRVIVDDPRNRPAVNATAPAACGRSITVRHFCAHTGRCGGATDYHSGGEQQICRTLRIFSCGSAVVTGDPRCGTFTLSRLQAPCGEPCVDATD